MASEWYCKKGENQLGPLTSDELRALISSGRAGPDDLIRKGTEGAWVPARRLTGVKFPAKVDPTARDSERLFTAANSNGAKNPVSEMGKSQIPFALSPSEAKPTVGGTSAGGPPPFINNPESGARSRRRRLVPSSGIRIWVISIAGAILALGVGARIVSRLPKGEPISLELSAANAAARVNTEAKGASPTLLTAPFSAKAASAAQSDWATYLGTEVTTTNSIGMKMVLIPPGIFQMGKDELRDIRWQDCGKLHQVTISKPYFVSETEITQQQWTSIMNSQPWEGEESVAKGDDFPAINMSWNAANEFCAKLSKREGRIYRIPTEAEWEYACRGGTKGEYSIEGISSFRPSELNDYAWISQEYDDELLAKKVATKKPNPFGLYDMHGNVCEWCWDWIDDFSTSPERDPTGPQSGRCKVLRGGTIRNSFLECRSGNRQWMPPSWDSPDTGFRIALSIDGQSANEVDGQWTEAIPLPPNPRTSEVNSAETFEHVLRTDKKFGSLNSQLFEKFGATMDGDKLAHQIATLNGLANTAGLSAEYVQEQLDHTIDRLKSQGSNESFAIDIVSSSIAFRIAYTQRK